MADAWHPLPVILRLSSWAVGRPDLTEWMVEQLSRTYDVPRLLSERWVKQGRLLPLLDGLDEMEEAARPACIAAINRYHHTHLLPLVVCSRQGEYEIAAKRERLALQSAVIVQPLSDEQIEGYLQAAGPSFVGVRTALHEQQELWELATTPLMLSVLLLTYRDAEIKDIAQQGTDLEQRVWTDYVARQVQEKGNETRYPLDRTRAWLGWLAQQMRLHQQTIFYAEYLQPDWLPKSQQPMVTRLTTLIPAMVIGACASILVWLFLEPNSDGVFLLRLGVLGGFVGSCLSASGDRKPANLGRCFQYRAVRHIRNAILLGILIAASFGLYLNPSSYGKRDWLRDGCIFGLGSLLSGWAFQVLVERRPRPHMSAPQQPLHLRGRLMTWLNTVAPSHIWQATVVLGAGIGLSYGLSDALGLSDPLSGGLSEALSYGLRVSITVAIAGIILTISLRTLRFAERIRWTWRGLFQPQHLRITMIVIMIVLLQGLCEGLSGGLLGLLSYGPGYGLIGALGSGLSGGLTYWLLLGLYQGTKQLHVENQNRFQFNQGIRHSLRNSLLVSLLGTIIITTMNVLSYGLGDALSHGLSGTLSYLLNEGLSDALDYTLSYYGLSIGLIVLFVGMVVMWALSGGPTVLRHYVIRWFLARHGIFPWRAQAFLDDASSRILLRRVGGGYQFIHRRLQDYFVNIEGSE